MAGELRKVETWPAVPAEEFGRITFFKLTYFKENKVLPNFMIFYMNNRGHQPTMGINWPIACTRQSQSEPYHNSLIHYLCFFLWSYLKEKPSSSYVSLFPSNFLQDNFPIL